VIANQMARKIPLELAGRVLSIALFYLGGPGDRYHSRYELDEDASISVGHLRSSSSP
jgi:hypothetical protein